MRPTIIMLAVVVGAAPATASSLKTLYAFGNGHAGVQPMGQLASDGAGNLYGTTAQTAYRLAFGRGAATATVLWTFVGGPVGDNPSPGLTAGPGGALFGATTQNNSGENPGCGSIYRVGAGGAAAVSRLNGHASVGCYPNAPVNVAADGDVFAIFQNGGAGTYGTIARFTPPLAGQTQWGQSQLYAFQGHADGFYPSVPMLLSKSGALYGSAIPSSNGQRYPSTVFQVAPPAAAQGAWQFRTIHAFPPSHCAAGVRQLAEDAAGTLYGPCSDTVIGGHNAPGTLFSLTPPAGGQGAWTYRLLWRFTGGADGGHPQTALTPDGRGNLYGTTPQGKGTLFRLSPDGSGGWKLTTLWTFTGRDGADPSSPLLLTAHGTLIGTTAGGGAGNAGTVFELTP